MLLSKQHNFGPVQVFEVGIAPFGKPAKSVYLYRLGSFLIDSGPHNLRKKVAGMLAGSKLSHILLTHHHEDHSGNAALIKNQFNAEVYLHSYGAGKLSKGFRILPYQHLLFGKAPSLEAQIYGEVIEGDGFTFESIHTPGHSKDHTVYFVKEKGYLFSGDLWVGEKIQFFRTDEHLDQQINSLRKIAELDFQSLLCGHRPKLRNGPALIKRKLDYLVSFQQQAIDYHQQGLEQREIVKRMRRKNDLPIKIFTMGNIAFSHMVKSALSSG